jgi:uncharacterized protein (DUF305 family)
MIAAKQSLRRLALTSVLLAGGLAVAAAAESPSTAGFKAAMDRMHMTMMAMAYSGYPDVDFARGMIPHHQGAIDMAEVELRYGKDPQLRGMAKDIIAAQQKEIATMKEWLAAHGG